jgi:hypothetical protein
MRGDKTMILNPIKANMTELVFENTHVLFSYRTPVAVLLDGVAYKTSKKWSNTTTRHINTWYREYDGEKPQEYFDNLVAGVK